MRRKDREVTDFQEILSILEACPIVRLGLADGDYPYIVPMNFGYTVEGEQLTLYIHGAMAGRRYTLLEKNPYCSFEMDQPLDIECMEDRGDVTMHYRSLMGKATARLLQGEEKQRAVDKALMGRYEVTRHFPYRPVALAHTAVWALTVTELTAKANPSRRMAD